MKCSLLLSIVCVANVALGAPSLSANDINYQAPTNYKLYQGTEVLTVNTGSDKAKIQKLEQTIKDWKLFTWAADYDPHGIVDVLVPAHKKVEFRKIIEGMEYKVMHADLADAICESQTYVPYPKNAIKDDEWFRHFHPMAEHKKYLNELVAAYPEQATLFVQGEQREKFAIDGNAEKTPGAKTSGGNTIDGILIRKGDSKEEKPAVVMHCTTHAREWITTPVCEYIARDLLGGSLNKYLDHFDFHIVPIANPDGFEYTQSSDRLWRKNRQDNKGSTCIGIDPARNWPAGWGLDGGASTDPCSNVYRGTKPAEALEIQYHTQYISSLPCVKLFIDWHSYLQSISWPYGYDCAKTPATAPDLLDVGKCAANAMKSLHGFTYDADTMCKVKVMGKLTGVSVDWAYEHGNAEYSFLIELRNGGYGFIVPQKEIEPSVMEAVAGFEMMLQKLIS